MVKKMTAAALTCAALAGPVAQAATGKLVLTGGVSSIDGAASGGLTPWAVTPHFKEANRKHVKEQLVEQFCQVTGGPCVYRGSDMKASHADLKIGRGDFNALVEVLQQAMDAQGIPFRAQNQLLAQLAPMHRDIITVK